MALTNAQLLNISTPLETASRLHPYADDGLGGLLPLALLGVVVLRAALLIASDPGTEANYTNRQRWVNTVTGSVTGPLDTAARMHAAVCVTEPAQTSLSAGNTPSDADLLSTVAALIDTFAGRI